MAPLYETSIIIDAPPATVWRILTDFPRYPDWNPFITAIEGELTVGKRLKVTIEPPGGKPMVMRPQVKAAVVNREFRWLGHLLVPGVFDGHHQFLLKETDQGTRFVQKEDFSGFLKGIILRMVGEATLNGFNQMNEALKELAEQEAAADVDSDSDNDPDEADITADTSTV